MLFNPSLMTLGLEFGLGLGLELGLGLGLGVGLDNLPLVMVNIPC